MNYPAIVKLAWALPALVTVLVIEIGFHSGFVVPVPFLAVFFCIVVAGAIGGQFAGFVAGLISTVFLIHAYSEQIGPQTLTGGIPQTLIGSMLFLFVGTLLGRLRDQRDTSIQSLRDKEKSLESSLQDETVESARQAARVAEREARMQTAIRIAGIGHFSFSTETGNCVFCSDQHAAHFGLTPEEFQSKTLGPLPKLFYVHEDDRQIVLDAIDRINSGESQMFEYRAVRPNGDIRYIREIEEPVFDDNGNIVENVGTSIDLTDLRQAEARLRQSQRIEAIGNLTGGVAHDFNNLLAIILGNLELCQAMDSAEHRHDLIQAAIDATQRGADLTKNLLSFSRRAHLAPSLLDLNQIVQRTTTWAARVLPETIAIESSLMAGLWNVELDRTSAENAIINILLNGRDAMPDGGKLTIETSNMRIDEDYVFARDEDIEPGRYVMLAISDTGHGIPADKIERIFEPFYTEKPVGLGSGLGLSMVQGFVKQSGGAIRVYSEVDVGTTFKLYFKAAENVSAAPNTGFQDPVYPTGNTASILVVEDEEGVKTVLRNILQEAGYQVKTARSGDEALETYKASRQFDLILTDVVMPGKLTGPALAKAIRAIDPELPCIFMSGYASEATVHGNGLRSSDIRLMKPVSRSELLKSVAKALNAAKPNDRRND